jgi:hypothetical protein
MDKFPNFLKFIIYKNWANLEKKFRKDERKPARVLKISSRKYVRYGKFLPPPPIKTVPPHT